MARTASASVAAGTALSQDVNVGGTEFLTVVVQVGSAGSPATAAGDASLAVQPYVDPAAPGPQVVTPVNLPTLESTAAALSSNVARLFARYRVSGLSKVRMQATNNNIAALPVEIDFDLG